MDLIRNLIWWSKHVKFVEKNICGLIVSEIKSIHVIKVQLYVIST
jgi:hypothetical protein